MYINEHNYSVRKAQYTSFTRVPRASLSRSGLRSFNLSISLATSHILTLNYWYEVPKEGTGCVKCIGLDRDTPGSLPAEY